MSLSLNRNKRPPKKPEDTNTRMCRLLRRMPMIPPGKSEDVEVVIETIKANEPVELVSFRNAMLMGKKPVRIQFASPVVTNALKYKHGVWMTTVPCELWQMDDAVQFLHGRVLFGGLGLGVAPTYAAYSRRIKEMVIVENDQRIINLVWPHLRKVQMARGMVRCKNLYTFLKQCPHNAYDTAFFDIWQLTGEMTWREHVVPLRRMARGKVGEVHCWLEAEMHGQLYPPLAFSLALSDDVGMPDYYRAFADVVRPLIPDLPRLSLQDLKPDTEMAGMSLIVHREAMSRDKRIMAWIDRYLDVSSSEWEGLFGESWDRNVKVRHADEVSEA